MTDRKIVPITQDRVIDRKITVTLFPDEYAKTKKEYTIPFRNLAEAMGKLSAKKEDLWLIKLAALGDRKSDKGCLRTNANVLFCGGIEVDYDGKKIGVDDAIERLRKNNLAAIVYTSRSHKPEEPRWRALLPASLPYDPQWRQTYVARVHGLFDGTLDPASFTMSQAFYCGPVKGDPHYRAETIDGRGIDEAVELDATALDRYGRTYMEIQPLPEPWTSREKHKPSGERQELSSSNSEFLDKMFQAAAFIPVELRDERNEYWLIIGAIFNHESGGSEEGFDLWDSWSQGDGITNCARYNAVDQRRVWDSFGEHSRPATSGTLFYLAAEFGYIYGKELFPVFNPDELTIAAWLARNIPAPDFLLGELLSTTTRAELIGPTGLGKTNFGMAMGYAVATGADFLHWPGSGKPRHVLIVDGEMSRRLMQRRLRDLVRRGGGMIPETLFVLSREDFEKMPPLNTKEGQDYIDKFIETIGGVDLIVFDNIQALTVGDMNDPASWEPVLPWMRDLTRREIGQLSIHHTGHDQTHGYGTKTREWQLDVVALMEQLTILSEADIEFRLTFTKARERSPDNRADFESVVITLAEDEWSVKQDPFARKTELQLPAGCRKLVELFHELNNKGPVTIEALRQECEKPGTLSKPATELESRQRNYRRARDEALDRKLIMIEGNLVLPFHGELE